MQEKLKRGRALPLMEEFYSVQGEGYHRGKPAYFVRIGGCDVGCRWCDVKESWDASLHPLVLTDSIVNNIADCPAKAVVVTGGEPLNYPMDYFCSKLREKNVEMFLETSGSSSFSGDWDWVCLSPKPNLPPLKEMLQKADELKVIIYEEKDFGWAASFEKDVRDDCMLYLQPEWSQRDTMLPLIIRFVKENPQWRVSIQSHKYMRIP